MAQKTIITGGPGSGKTTLVEALGEFGHHHCPEVSRRLIREQMEREDAVLPWHDLNAFAALVVDDMLRDHDLADDRDGTVFFDRGLPDVFGYLDDGGLDVPPSWLEAHDRCTYSRTVFILPPWPDIYINDTERPQNLSKALTLSTAIARAYAGLGYELIEVPRIASRERAEFVLEHL